MLYDFFSNHCSWLDYLCLPPKMQENEASTLELCWQPLYLHNMFFWLKRILNLFYNFHDSKILRIELIKWSCKKCKSLSYSKWETYIFRSTSNICCYYFSTWKSRDDVGIVLSRSNNIVNDTFNIYQVLIANWSTGWFILFIAYIYIVMEKSEIPD